MGHSGEICFPLRVRIKDMAEKTFKGSFILFIFLIHLSLMGRKSFLV
jgi:hypothetical protein